MPVSRANTMRNKSRSPANPLTPNPSTPRPFLPPSHYAAAGGLTTQNHSVNDHGEPSRAKKSRNAQVNATQKHFPNVVEALPRPDPSSSESSLVSVADHQLLASNTHSKHQRTQSGFLELEAQLLPSLRDTIDRMTRVPSRASTPFKTGAGNTEFSASGRRNRDTARQISPEPRTTAKSTSNEARRARSKGSPRYSPANDALKTPNIPHIYSNETTPIIGKPSSQLKTPTISVLKSSLRSPAPSSPQPSGPSNSPSVTGSSLRTMKSLLTRKYSETLKSPFSSNKVSREASHKDLGEIESSTPEQFAPRLYDEMRHSPLAPEYRDQYPSTKKAFSSSIPRPRTRYYHDEPNRNPNTEDSDLDRRYEDELRDRRKLKVANAEVAVSGSSSDSDADLLNAGRQRKNVNHAHHSPIGLGLSLRRDSPSRSGLTDNRTTFQPSNPRFPPGHEKTLRFSLPMSESAGSAYSDEFNNYLAQSNQRNYGIDNANAFSMSTKAAVSTFPQAVKSRRTHLHRPSSRSPTTRMKQESIDQESELSDRDEYSFREPTFKERRRSSSCTPTFSASPELESDGFVPIIPPRSRSACQRRRSPSPNHSPAFPSDLQELIKSRQSLSKTSTKFKESRSSPSSPRTRHRIRDVANQPKSPGTTRTPQPTRYSRGDLHRFDICEHTQASAIAEEYRSAAARERMAFGIPPSESDEVLDNAQQHQQLSATESEMSSINASLWQEDSDDLSEGAESIFKALKYTRKEGERNNQQHAILDRTPRLSVISPSGSSTNEEHINEGRWHQHDPAQHRAESSRSRDEKESESQRGLELSSQDLPNTREGVIQEIFETEEELLRRFHICMQMFILPLRVHNSPSWIAGVPPNVARLLDWFDDIVKLHEQVYQSLCSARDTMSPATDRVSETLRPFVLKAEIYQPYLVRLADVSEEIVHHVNDSASDFGQFVILQQKAAKCEGWSFERLLMMPVNRLAEYQDLFARMLDLTPKTHQDYLSTFSLSRSTDMVIRVMTEVKIREDEYNLLKAFASRVQGLSYSNDLANRERRLLHSGPLELVVQDVPATSAASCTPSYDRRKSESKRASRASKLVDVVNTSSSVFERSDSERSASSFGTGNSSGTGTGPPATSTPVKSSWFSRLPLRKRARSKSPLPPQEPFKGQNTIQPLGLQTLTVHAFVFNDLVLLAQPSQTTGDKPRWILSRDLGIFRPLSIARIQDSSQGTILSLETLVLDADSLNDTTDFRSSSFRNVDLVLPPPLNAPPSADGDGRGHVETFQPWLLAFRQCSRTTLRKLTFIGHGHQGDLFIGSDKQFDTRMALASLIGSGLPIPRSPSGELPDSNQDGEVGLPGDEREERGWWTLRYQQVFREFQRQDSLLSDDDDTP